MGLAQVIRSALLGIASCPAAAYAVTSGAPIAVAQAPAAVQVFPARGYAGTCSATKIGERAFLTAAHCVAGGVGEEGTRVVIAQSSDAGGARYREQVEALVVRASIFGPWRRSPDAYQAFVTDLGVIEIDAPTPKIAIAKLPAGPMELWGRRVFVAGYGGEGSAWHEGSLADGSAWSVSPVSDARALVGEVAEVKILPEALLVARARDVPVLGRGAAEYGDSGAGLMLQEDPAKIGVEAGETVVGVVSGGRADAGALVRVLFRVFFEGAHTVAARLDRPEVLAWLRARLDAAAGDG